MFGRKPKRNGDEGALDGGEGRGLPLGGHDELPHAGYQPDDEEDLAVDDSEDRDFLWEEGDPADRRRDPLRRP